MPFVSSIFVSLLVSVIFMTVLGLLGARYFSRLISTPKRFLIPTILLFCLIGSFAINNSMFDIGVLIASGLVGFVLRKFGYPVAPVILGMILGPMFERNLRRSLMLSRGDWSTFVTRPISLAFILIAIFVVIGPWLIATARSLLGRKESGS
jgi:putative tricarboxylic transport membrane protein